MRSVIMIAFGFPPEGYAGVYRPLRFVRRLPDFGWSPRVIAGDFDRYGYSRYDPGLLAQIPVGTEVVRVQWQDPWQVIQARRAQRIERKGSQASGKRPGPLAASNHFCLRSGMRSLVRATEAWCYHPDMAMPWIKPAVEAAIKMCVNQRPDVIWATAGPVSSCIVAQRVSQLTSIPYVLDFRDAWTITYNEFEALRPAWARAADQRRMYRFLKGAQAVVFLYDTMAECYWRAYPGALGESQIHIIPNGFEGAVEGFEPPAAEKCTLLYTGTLSSYRYDTFLEAIRRLKNLDASRARKLQVLLVGEGMEALAGEVAASGISDIVQTMGSKSQAEVARLQREAHAVLIFGRARGMRGYELFASAKLFGYLKCGRPIVGVLPPDESRKILHRIGAATVADVDSPSEILTILHRIIDAWSTRTLPSLVPSRSACEVYSAGRQTAALAAALEAAPAVEPFVPGTVAVPPSLRKHLEGGLVDMNPHASSPQIFF